MKRLGSSCSTVSAADGCYVVAQCDQSATSPPDCPLGRTLEYRNDLELTTSEFPLFNATNLPPTFSHLPQLRATKIHPINYFILEETWLHIPTLSLILRQTHTLTPTIQVQVQVHLARPLQGAPGHTYRSYGDGIFSDRRIHAACAMV